MVCPSVLQISFRQKPVSRFLVLWTLPDKIRHSEITEIQVAISVVFGDGIYVLHDSLDHSWWYHNTTLVVEEDVVISVAVVGPGDLAHGVERSGNISEVPAATDRAVSALNVGDTLTELLDNLATCAREMLTRRVGCDLDPGWQCLWVGHVPAGPAIHRGADTRFLPQCVNAFAPTVFLNEGDVSHMPTGRCC